MTEESPPENEADAKGIDTRWTGSQAEGDRDTVQEDIEQKFGGKQPQQKPAGTGGDPLSTPSQAEGDRDTVEDDVDQKQR